MSALGPIDGNILKHTTSETKGNIPNKQNIKAKSPLIGVPETESHDQVDLNKSAEQIVAQNRVASTTSLQSTEEATKVMNDIRQNLLEDGSSPVAGHLNVNRNNVLSLLNG